MKITALETLRIDEFPNLLWVQVHTDQGLVGLGETFYGPDSAEGHIHSIIAAYLLGQDPLLIDRHHAQLIGYVGFNGSSAEQRARSAVDIALWGLWGQACGQPIHQLLGGAVRDDICGSPREQVRIECEFSGKIDLYGRGFCREEEAPFGRWTRSCCRMF